MKAKGLLTVLCVLLVFSLVLGCNRDSASRGAVEGSAAIVTPPGQLPIVKESITLTLGLMQNRNVNNYETNYLTGWLEERTGIKNNFHLFSSVTSDANTQFELMVSAGEKLPDLMLFNPGNTGDWMLHGDNGVFIDLAPYFQNWAYFLNERLASLPASEVARIVLNTTSASGKRYAYPSYSQQANMIYDSMNFINQSWLDRLGLPMPSTTEEFFNTMIAFRDRNPTGTGIPTIPYIGGTGYGSQPLIWIINSYVYHPYASHNNWFLNVTDGKIWTAWTTEEYREALRYLNRLYRENIIHPSTFTNTQAEVGAILSYQRGETGRGGFFSAAMTQVLLNNTPAVYDFTFQRPLVGPKGVNYYPLRPHTAGASAFVTRDCEYPEAAFRWLDQMSDKNATMAARYGEVGVDWRWTTPEENAISFFNTPAVMEQFHTLWAMPNNKHWQLVPGGFYINGINDVLMKWTNDGSFDNVRLALYQTYEGRAGGKDVSETVGTILYSEQELNDIREMRASINTYREESLALFVTGSLSLDRDWAAYLATMDRMGLQRYLEITQRAYTRTIQLAK